MTWMPIHAGKDHLAQYSKQKPVDALVELIWNSLDAEADEVDVEVESSSLGTTSRDMYYVTRITVTDNGHGITPEIAQSAFPSLGDSWKKTLSGRTLNGKRALHGQLGRGRFYAYALGSDARWYSVSDPNGDGQLVRILVEGNQDKIDGFTTSAPVSTTDRLGTRVVVNVQQGHTLSPLLRDDLNLQIAARLAPHLLANRDLSVRINGSPIITDPLIENTPIDVPLDNLDVSDLNGREIPVLTVVDWTDEMRNAPGIVLCNENGMALVEVENTVPAGTVKSTGYLKWSGFSESANELLLAQLTHTTIIQEATKRLEKHVRDRVGALTITVIETLRREGSYPFSENPTDPIQQTEQEIFDVVAVTARTAFTTGSRQQRAMSARLVKLALEERPEDLDEILAQTLSLSDKDRAIIADMLRYSTLGKIVGAAAEVARRLDLIATLRHIIYSPEVSDRMREVDQLHPLIKDEAWLFGEDWRLSRSEASLASVLRTITSDDTALEVDLNANAQEVLLPDGRRGRIDLLFQRLILTPGEPQRLVVELKRPSVSLGNNELTQIRGYASTLSSHDAAGPSRWTFWLVGSSCREREIGGQMKQRDRAWGHIETGENYDIWVTTWGRLLDDAERRFSFYREQLQYDISQDDAVDRVRSLHAEMLPAEEPPAESSTNGSQSAD